MDYLSHLTKFSLIILLVATSCLCWEFHISLLGHTFKDTLPNYVRAHQEYIYGDCIREDKIIYTSVRLENKDVLDKVIFRDWLDVPKMPTCVVIRGIGKDNMTDVYKTTTYSFQFCVLHVTFCHSQRRYRYYYYEWYVPYDMVADMTWEIYFFGQNDHLWT